MALYRLYFGLFLCLCVASESEAQSFELMQLISEGGQGLPQFEPSDIQLSPNGEQAYVSSLHQGLIVFERDPTTGDLFLPPIQAFCDTSGSMSQCLPGSISVSYLGVSDYFRRIAIDPLGRYVYVTSWEDGALNVFLRDPTTGLLVFRQALHGSAIVSQVPVYSYVYLSDVVVSPSGDNVYVISRSFGRGTYANTASITSLQRTEDPDDGLIRLNRIQTLIDDFFDQYGITGADALAMSADGHDIYVVSDGDRALSHFLRDDMGLLSFVDSLCENNLSPPNCSAGVIRGVCDLVISPDGYHMYTSCEVGGIEPGSTVVFDLDSAGNPSFNSIALNSGGNRAAFLSETRLLDSAGDTAGSPDFRLLERDPATGSLAVLDTFNESGLGAAQGLAVDAERAIVYTGIPGNGAAGSLAIYSVPEPGVAASTLAGIGTLLVLAHLRRSDQKC